MNPGRRDDERPTDERPTVDEGRRRLVTWLWRLPVIAAAGGAAYGLVEVYRVHFAKMAPDPSPAFTPRTPTDVGALTAFAAPWDGVPFELDRHPCVALRLPDPIPGGVTAGDVHLAAFSRVCTHQACLLDVTRDPEAIAFAFNHRTDRPQLTCACHYSVFDPVRAGRAVSGPAVRPLPRARLRIEGAAAAARVVSDGIEELAA